MCVIIASSVEYGFIRTKAVGPKMEMVMIAGPRRYGREQRRIKV